MTEILHGLNRKRHRSTSNDCNYENQAKYFINQQIVNLNDANKMKEIHDKTIKLLFKNANAKESNDKNDRNNETNGYINKMDRFRQSIRLSGNGYVIYLKDKIVGDRIGRKCGLCLKQSSLEKIDCINCNLEICESCGISCVQCNGPLCVSCVRLFGCSDATADMNPLCMGCKQIYG